MSSPKRSPIDRVLAFYREQSADVVRVTHQLTLEVMKARGIGNGPVRTVVKRGRKPKASKEVTGESATTGE